MLRTEQWPCPLLRITSNKSPLIYVTWKYPGFPLPVFLLLRVVRTSWAIHLRTYGPVTHSTCPALFIPELTLVILDLGFAYCHMVTDIASLGDRGTLILFAVLAGSLRCTRSSRGAIYIRVSDFWKSVPKYGRPFFHFVIVSWPSSRYYSRWFLISSWKGYSHTVFRYSHVLVKTYSISGQGFDKARIWTRFLSRARFLVFYKLSRR